jgi:hypothetical protein
MSLRPRELERASELELPPVLPRQNGMSIDAGAAGARPKLPFVADA